MPFTSKIKMPAKKQNNQNRDHNTVVVIKAQTTVFVYSILFM